MKRFATYTVATQRVDWPETLTGATNFCSFSRLIEAMQRAGEVPRGEVTHVTVTEQGLEFKFK